MSKPLIFGRTLTHQNLSGNTGWGSRPWLHS